MRVVKAKPILQRSTAVSQQVSWFIICFLNFRLQQNYYFLRRSIRTKIAMYSSPGTTAVVQNDVVLVDGIAW